MTHSLQQSSSVMKCTHEIIIYHIIHHLLVNYWSSLLYSVTTGLQPNKVPFKHCWYGSVTESLMLQQNSRNKHGAKNVTVAGTWTNYLKWKKQTFLFSLVLVLALVSLKSRTDCWNCALQFVCSLLLFILRLFGGFLFSLLSSAWFRWRSGRLLLCGLKRLPSCGCLASASSAQSCSLEVVPAAIGDVRFCQNTEDFGFSETLLFVFSSGQIQFGLFPCCPVLKCSSSVLVFLPLLSEKGSVTENERGEHTS